jgi:uncharacterized membrane protein
LKPLVYLSNNWLSLIGVIVVTTAAIFWLFLLPSTLGGEMHNPYMGILAFMVVVILVGLGFYKRTLD